MREVIAEASFDDFLSQQAQRPARMAFRRLRTGKSGDFGALRAITLNRATRAWRILKAGQASRVIAVTPGGDSGGRDLECGGNLAQGFAAVEFEQRSGTFELS